jgi:predicted DNA-binding antitoxin AbrB/MazE fold protein
VRSDFWERLDEMHDLSIKRRLESMAQAVRAVYEQGCLRLLDPVNLIEGQEIHVMLVSEREQARAVLDDLLVQYAAEPVEEIDETRLLAEIDAAMQGQPPVSDAIIEERREGP